MGKAAGDVEGLGRDWADDDDFSLDGADGCDGRVQLGDESGIVEAAIGPEGGEIDAADGGIGADRGEGGAIGGGAARVGGVIAEHRRAA